MGIENDVKKLVSKMDGDVDAVVVEGENDAKAIGKAGFTGEVYKCSENNSGIVSLGRTVTRENDSVAILTDYDEEGKELNRDLQRTIPEGLNRKIWRKKLGKVLTRKGRRDIESINNLVEGSR